MTPQDGSAPRVAPGFESPHVERYIREWAADQRERERWKDGDQSTYRFRANALEGILAEIERLRAALEREREKVGLEIWNEIGRWYLMQASTMREITNVRDEIQGMVVRVARLWPKPGAALAPAGPATTETNQPKEDHMKPSIGRIVHYRLAQHDADAINRRRVAGAGHGEDWPKGAQAHSGNSAAAGEIVPMVIVRVWSEHGVNGQCLLDGNDTLWVTSRTEGDEDGKWSWPVRET